MAFHDLILFRRQSARFAQDLIRDANLADIVQQAADTDIAHGFIGQPQFFRDPEREVGHVFRVPAGVAVFVVNRRHHRVQNAEGTFAAKLPIGVLRFACHANAVIRLFGGIQVCVGIGQKFMAVRPVMG